MRKRRLGSNRRALDINARLLPFSVSLLEQQSKHTTPSQAHQRGFPLDWIIWTSRHVVRHVEFPSITLSFRVPEDARLGVCCSARSTSWRSERSTYLLSVRENRQPVQTNQGAQLVVWIIVGRPYLHHLTQGEACRIDQDAATVVDHRQVISHMAPCYMGNMVILGNRGPQWDGPCDGPGTMFRMSNIGV